MEARGIPEDVIRRAVERPFARRPARDGRRVHEVAEIIGTIRTWVRVVLDGSAAEPVVVTVYPVSQIPATRRVSRVVSCAS